MELLPKAQLALGTIQDNFKRTKSKRKTREKKKVRKTQLAETTKKICVAQCVAGKPPLRGFEKKNAGCYSRGGSQRSGRKPHQGKREGHR